MKKGKPMGIKIRLYAGLALGLALALPLGGCLAGLGDIAPPFTSTPPLEELPALNLYNVEPYTLDPAVCHDSVSNGYVVQLFGGLVRLDEEFRPAPDIAEDWEVSPDGRTYTFHLRQDVRFHDGDAVTAADFKYSWERACRPATESDTAEMFLGDIVGVREVLSGERDGISGVEVMDEHTLRVTIDEPRSYFLYKLSYATAFVVDEDNVGVGGEWWRRPNGTGPFVLSDWLEDELIVLMRNERYHGEVAGVGRVNFKLWAGVPMNLYETGEIDVTGVSAVYIDRVIDEKGPFYDDLTMSPEISFSYIGFDATRPPFDEAVLRRAFCHAIDKEKIVSLTYRDMMEPAYGILPPGMPGYDEGLDGLRFDVDEAHRLIAQSSYGDVDNLPPITITTPGRGPGVSAGLGAVVSQWRENLGVEVKVRKLDPERFFYHTSEEKDEMFILGWVADYPHPQNFLETLFYSSAEANHGEYANPRFDELVAEANAELDWEESVALYRRAEGILVEDAACIPLWFGESYTLVKPYVEGYRLNPMGIAMLNDVKVLPLEER